MPQPRLSSVERRRRAAARKARWRSSVAAPGPARDGFIYAAAPPAPPQATAQAVAELQPLGEEDRTPSPQLGSASGPDNVQEAREPESAWQDSGFQEPDDDYNVDIPDWQDSGVQDDNPPESNIDREDDDIGAAGSVDEGESDGFSEPDGDFMDLDLDSDLEANTGQLDGEMAPIRRHHARDLVDFYPAPDTEQATPEDEPESDDEAQEGANQEEEDDEALLAAQIEAESGAENEPQVDYAYELGRHLIEFKGCTQAEHNRQAVEHQADHNSNANHLPFRGYIQMLDDCTPWVLDKASLLTAEEREALPSPKWRLAFEGRFPQDADVESDEELEDLNENTCSDPASTDKAGDSDIDSGNKGSDSEPESGRTNTDSQPQHSSESAGLSPQASDQASNRKSDLPVIYLCCNQLASTPGAITYDVDSFCGYARSLAFARQGVTIDLFPRFHVNFQGSQHIYVIVYYDHGGGRKAYKVPIQKIPMIYCGRVLGREDIEIYISFESMYDPEKPTNFPGKVDGESHSIIRFWTDSIFLPALFRHLPPTGRQHLPPTWEHARRKAQAYYKERRVRSDSSGSQAQALSLHYRIHPDSLAAVWADVERQLALPVNHLYSGAKLFFLSKNTKAQFAYPTLAGAWDAFNSTLSTSLNLAYVDREKVWLDLGKETIGCDYALPGEQLGADSHPATYLARTCCQASFAEWAALGEKGRSVKATYYPIAMLGGISDMTLNFSRNCQKRLTGWVYSQMYNSVKEIIDAAKTKPFCHPNLCQLAWDEGVAKMLYHAGKGGSLEARSQLFANYLESKARLLDAVTAARRMSYGVREEHRISLAFLDRMKESLQETGDWDRPIAITNAIYEHFWEVATLDYMRYISYNTNKFMAAFEWTLSLDHESFVGYEHCKLMTMLLQALPFTFDSGPSKNRQELWQTTFQRRDNGPFVLGMGIKKSLEKYNYGWILPRIDWGQMVFRPRLADQVAFASSMLRDTYRRNWARVKDAKDDLSRLEAALQWFVLYGEAEEVVDWLVRFILIIIVRSYRKEVLHYLKPIIRPEFHEAAAKGELMLCERAFEEYLVPETLENMHLMNPKRAKIKSIEDLVSFLWDFDAERRGRWQDAPFRLLCQRTLQFFGDSYGQAERAEFHHLIKRYWVATNYLVPQPTVTKFIQRGRRKEILWIGLFHRRMVVWKRPREGTTPMTDIFPTTTQQPGRKDYRPGPDDYPWPVPFQRWKVKGQGYVPKKYRFMEDWDLVQGSEEVGMRIVPEDWLMDNIPVDSDLRAIKMELDHVWRAWRQVEGEEED